MRQLIIIFVCAMALFASGSAYGQSLSEGARIVDSKIDFKGHEMKGSFVVISYEIPYSGMVEIHLFNEKGDKIWQSQYPQVFGENRIVLKAGKFNPGEKYSYVLNYKRDEIRESIVVPSSNFPE